MDAPAPAAPQQRSRGADILLTMASLVVVCAGISAASSIVVPVLAAIFVAAVALPPIVALRARGAPAWLAVTIVLAIVAGALFLTGTVLARTAASFGENFNEYRATLQSQVTQIETWFAARGVDLSQEHLGDLLDPGRLLSMVKGGLAGVIGVLRDGVFVVVMVGFLLAEAAGLPAKIKLAFRIDDATLGPWRRILDDMTGYLVVKTKTSFLTSVLVTIAMWILGEQDRIAGCGTNHLGLHQQRPVHRGSKAVTGRLAQAQGRMASWIERNDLSEHDQAPGQSRVAGSKGSALSSQSSDFSTPRRRANASASARR